MNISSLQKRRWFFGFLLLFALTLILGIHVSRDTQEPAPLQGYSSAEGDNQALPRQELQETPEFAASDANENTPPGTSPALQEPERNPASSDEEPERDWITRVISETWIDDSEKLADRRRVRIVDADFKYPNLRLEESVTTDPDTGDESATLVRASVADHLMLGLRDGADPERAAAAIRDLGYSVRDMQPDAFILAEIPAFVSAEDQARAMTDLASLNEFIDFAEPDWIVNTFLTPNDPAFQQGRMWALENIGRVAGTVAGADIDARAGWAVRTDASDVVVAVTDTGIRYTHEDLAANMWTDTDGRFGIDAYDDDDDPMDPNGHGTHCAGTIGARGNNNLGIAGVAWDVQLMALRFIGPNGGTTSDAIKVINYARQNGAHIINASWGGGGYSQGLHNAILACHEAGILFVAAAGNQSSDNDTMPTYPSSYRLPNIVSVAATDSADELTVFSNFGKNHVHLAAPGHDIWSCGIASDTDYRHLSGTSMAAPHVAGALALARAHFPGESVGDLITRLHSAVDMLPWLDDHVVTGGRLNLRRLLLESDPVPPHDSFDTPFVFTGSNGDWIGVNERASREPGEDTFSPDSGSRSLWFRWQAPDDGLVRFSATVGTGDLSLAAFRGETRAALVRVDDNFTRRLTASDHLYFYADAGATYTFSVDSRHTEAQRVRVELSQQPANDNFHDAHDLGNTARIDVRASNRGATPESFELSAPHAGVGAGRSVWWKWTPSFTGNFILTTRFSRFDTVLAVYQGNSPGNLTEVAANDDRRSFDWTSEVEFHVNEGATYHIVVDSYRGTSTGNIVLNGYRPGTLAILNHPQSQVVRSGGSAIMRVATTGNNRRFQWELDGQPIPGATRSVLRVRNAEERDFGTYRVRVSSPTESVMSQPAILTEFLTPPSIRWQTPSRSLSSGDDIELHVRATGTPPLSYQWFRNDVEIEGATSDTLRFEDVDASVEAGYQVAVSNAAGETLSRRIVLRVFDVPWGNFDFIDPASQAQAVFAIEYHDGLWLAASRTGSLDGIRFSTSDDGRNWSHQVIEPGFPDREVTGKFLVRGNGFWLCGGPGIPSSGVFYKSTDRLEWERIHLNIPLNWGSSINDMSEMLFHEGYFYLSGGNRVYRSADGINWVKQTLPDGSDIIAYKMWSAPPGLLVEGNTSVQAYFMPTGSETWQTLTVDPGQSGIGAKISNAIWNVDHFVAYTSTRVYSSANGIHWTQGTTLPNNVGQAEERAQNGNLAFANISGHQNYLSTDGGLTWQAYTQLFPPNSVVAAIDDQGLAVFGSNKGALIAVEDLFAVREAYPVPMFTNALDDLVYEGGQFIATNHDVMIAVSADGDTWQVGRPKNIPHPQPGVWPGIGVPIYINGEYWRPGLRKLSPPYYPYLRGPVPSASFVATLPSAPDDSLTAIADGPAGILGVRVNRMNSQGDMVLSTDGGATWEVIPAPGGPPGSGAKLLNVHGVYFYDAVWGGAYISTDLENWTNIGDITHLVYNEGEYWALHQSWVKKTVDLVNWTDPVQTGMEWFGRPVSFNGAVVAPIGGKLHYSYNGVDWVHIPTTFRVSHIAASPTVMIIASSQGHLARMGTSREAAPVVRITEPTEEAVFVEGGRILVNIEAYHPEREGDPAVRVFYDGVPIATLTSPPYEIEIPSGQAGGHLIHAECQLGDGLVSLATRHIVVQQSHHVNRISQNNGMQALPGQIVYRNGIYIAHATNSFMGSTDGRDWHAMAIPAMIANPRGIVAGNDRLVAFGTQFDVNIAVSRDGVNWVGSKLPKASSTPLYHSDGYFWGVTSGGAAADGILLSEDGLNWTLRNIMIRPSSLQQAVGNPNGILLGRTSSNLWRSADGGRTWFLIPGFTNINGLDYDGGRFHIRTEISGQRHVGSSIDGLSWDWAGPDARFMQLQVVDGTSFVFNTQDRLIAVSYDGLEWLDVPGEPRATHITRGEDGYFYAAVRWPDNSVPALHRSVNGIDWEHQTGLPTTGTYQMFSTPDGLFISPGNGSLWVLEWGAVEWAQLANSAAAVTSIRDVEAGGGMLLAIANNGTRILRSTDGANTWLTSFDLAGSGLPSSLRLTQLMHLDGVWLAWHRGVALLRSVDGISFTNITANSGATTFGGLAHDGSQWMAIRDDGAIVTSDDGLAWTTHGEPGTYPDGRAFFLTSHLDVWYAISPVASGLWNTRMLASTDGLTWSPTTMPNITSTGAAFFAAKGSEMIVGPNNARYTADMLTGASPIVAKNAGLQDYLRSKCGHAMADCSSGT